MSARNFLWVRSPSNANQCLGAYFTISDFGSEPHGRGEHFDPGHGPEFDVVAVIGEDEKPIAVSASDLDAISETILHRFDFATAARTDREAGMFLFEGAL